MAPAADILQEQGPIVLRKILNLRKPEICTFMHNFQVLLWKDITGGLTHKPTGWLQPGSLQSATPA